MLLITSKISIFSACDEKSGQDGGARGIARLVRERLGSRSPLVYTFPKPSGVIRHRAESLHGIHFYLLTPTHGGGRLDVDERRLQRMRDLRNDAG
jgi:hypothetical protein